MARTALVRINEATQVDLKKLAEASGQTMQALLAEAVETLRRQRFFEELNAAAIALRKDPHAWEEELQERREWEATLLDGLEDDPWEMAADPPSGTPQCLDSTLVAEGDPPPYKRKLE